MLSIHQPGDYDMYLCYSYNMMFFALFFIWFQTIFYLSRERLYMIKLDDYNILQRDHLVRNRSSP
jgi:hypothetical protein